MKTLRNAKDSFVKHKSWQFFAFFAVIVLILVGGVFHFFRNYAAETAKPLDAALTKAGAVKECSNGDPGLGPDNDRPWYDAIFQVPGDEDKATNLVRTAVKEAGYSLKNGPNPVSPGNNKYYSDEVSKKSTHSDLEQGNVQLLVTVLGGQVWNGKNGDFCGTTGIKNPTNGHTTIDVTLNMPRFKHY